MQLEDNSIKAFYELVRAGLWETEVGLSHYNDIDFSRVLALAEEQSVIGLVAAGIEHITDVKVPKEVALQLVGQALQLEQRNKAMNSFVAELITLLRKNDIYTLLVKGQGVAQCYEKPLWRAAGDVDLYLSKENYEKAKLLLIPRAHAVENEDKKRLHLGMSINEWVVELHGTMYTEVSRMMNLVSDEVHYNLFYRGSVRSWDNNGVQVFLPSPDNDVIIIFNHFINHFYGEGIGLRQVCDWCRLLWKYRNKLDYKVLESRIRKAGLMTEWKAFAKFAVKYLGTPVEAMPLYEDSSKYDRKADKIKKMIIKTGNFGQNKDNRYRNKYPKLLENVITFYRRLIEFVKIGLIFPQNAPKFFLCYLVNRVRYQIN